MDNKQIVIKLDIVDIDRNDNTYFQYTVGYYSSYEMLEKVMPALYVIKEDTLFLTEEIQVDTIINNEDYYKDYVTQRQYRWVGKKIKLIHETPYNFNGYKKEEEYQYKVGDVIEYLSNKEKIETGIIASIPPRNNNEKMYFDFTDDSYLVYEKENIHKHIMSCNIIGLAKTEEITNNKGNNIAVGTQ